MADNTAETIITATEKYGVTLFSILLLTSGILLFWPAGAVLFQLDSLPSWITDFKGVVFFASVIALLLLVSRSIYRGIASRRAETRYREVILKNLWSLGGQERAILREFFLFDSDVQDLPMQAPAVLSLRNKRIISVAVTSGLAKGRNMEFPLQLPPRVKELVEPEMIDLHEAQEIQQQNSVRFEASRPHFRQSNSWY